MSERTDLKIFIASSSDLNDVRDESTKVIVELNKKFNHLHLEPVLFELDTSSGNNPGLSRIQDGINPLLDVSEIVVVIFYSRVGLFTKEEFERAKSQNKKIFVYLKEGYQPHISNESLKYTEVLKLKEQIETESEIRYQKFKDIYDYNGIFYKDLHKYIEEKYSQHENHKTNLIELSASIYENKLIHYPRPKPYFTGREHEIEDFKNSIDLGINFIAVDGPGGIGKSQFVSRCIELYIPEEKIVWYDCIPGSQFDTLISDAGYPELLKGSSKTVREKFSAFKDKIEENNYFIFLNNFHETNNNPIFKEFLEFVQEYLKKGCVVVIDRDNIASFKITPKRIQILGFTDQRLKYAKALINNSYNNTVKLNDVELDKLCQELKGYPLAIDFAIYLLSEGVSASEIISKIVQEAEAEQISERLLNAIFIRHDATFEEKEFIRQFSVFTGSVTYETIAAIIHEDLVKTAPRLLQKKNLLSFTNNGYEIHPLVREFCYKELKNKEEIHSKVAEHFITLRTNELSSSLEEQIFFHLAQSKQWDRIEKEIEEQGRQFILLGQLGLVKELVMKLKKMEIEKPIFEILLGDIAEIQGEWEIAQSCYNNARLNENDKRIKTEGIIKYGEILHKRGDLVNAAALYQQAYEFASESGYLKEEARALNDLGLVYGSHGDLDISFKKINEALTIRRKIKEKQGIGDSLINLSSIFFTRGELESADQVLKQSLEVYEEIGDKSGIAHTLNLSGNNLRAKGLLNEAMKLYQKAYSIAKSIGDKRTISDCLQIIGGVHENRNKLDLALANFNESLKISEIIGYKHGAATSMAAIADILGSKGKFKAALELYNSSLEIMKAVGEKAELAKLLNNIGRLYHEQGKLDEAISKFKEGLKLKEEIGATLSMAATYHNIATLYSSKQKQENDLALYYLLMSYSLNKSSGIKLALATNINWINSIKDSLAIAEFKSLIQKAYNQISPEMQKNIDLNDFFNSPIRKEIKIGRNDPCTCGSGKKYKQCHGLNN